MIKKIINNSPTIIKNTIRNTYFSIPDYYRFGKIYRSTFEFLEKSQWWDRKKLEEYQIEKLKFLINYAYNTVPYYNNLFNEYDIKVSQIQEFSDLKSIPYLTKEIIQNNLKNLVSNRYNINKLSYVTTGGSTGIPMGFYRDKNYDKQRENAFIAQIFKRIGYSNKQRNRFVILAGKIPKNEYYEYKDNNLILSSFKLIEENIEEYLQLIKNYNPDFITAYPSSIILIANYIISTNKKYFVPNLKAIICRSENIYDSQRDIIEAAFNVRTFSFYGHTEHACIGGECEKSNYYHLQSEYGYTEIINENGQEVRQEDEIGEIVTTGFNNYVVPFIRYKTCDMVINTNKKCECGREYKLIKKVNGRKQEYFVDKNKNKITFTCSDDCLWKIKNKIWAYQYVQNKCGQVILNVEWKEKHDVIDYHIIRKDFKLFYPTLEIDIRDVKYIERTKRGKFKYLIQNVIIE